MSDDKFVHLVIKEGVTPFCIHCSEWDSDTRCNRHYTCNLVDVWRQLLVASGAEFVSDTGWYDGNTKRVTTGCVARGFRDRVDVH